ncbi:hypothetical protein [Variovorax paradoxus]|uniref:hypothetical protein n=1 Tax=Variovorax paradoxus TaxID=34073 RepID=UPI0027851254|nr:hypothetical protein [Variovorax paradoxus]MDP9931551.1 outer membrane lipopolysaccharide assembly protein LptE/RlpB [Variovorax paradoxus]
MSTLTTAQLLGLTRPGKDTAPPAGFGAVSADRLTLPLDVQSTRINYQAFFNPATNELVITGTPRAVPRLDLVTQTKVEDTNIFSDSVRITRGPRAGGFDGPSDPVTQTLTLVESLTANDESPYPNATVSFAGEGAVGLAFSAASYELRNDPTASARVGSTVTLNAWTGHWTPDGSVDTGVLDVRTPNPANGDPGIGSLHVGVEPWRPGGVVAAVNTGNAQRAGAMADIGTQGAMAMAELLTSKLGGRVLGESAAWVADKLIGKGAEAFTEPAADAAAGAAANYIDSPARAVKALGWQANLTPAETTQVVQQGIGQGQWNVMHGLSPAGYAVDGTYYENTGAATVAGAGSTAETRQPAVQVTTWRDETTGAIMEARISGQRVDGQFEGDRSSVFASGMDTAGRMILTGSAAQSVADYQMRPVASRGTDASASEDPALAPVVVEAGSGLGTYTTVSIQTHANGTASFDFVGEDGSRAWVMHDAETGDRTVTINSGQEVAGEPRTVIYDLDRNGVRVGQERYFDAMGAPVNERGEVQAPQAAPAQQEPIPQITTHESRIVPTPGGMSFAEAHRRRDEPEQISAGSLQPVGKLDEIHRAKSSPLYRVHQAQEQDLMRGLGIAQAQDRERFKNEPSPQRTLQPSGERTQEQASRRVLEEAPAQKQAEAQPPALATPAVQAPTRGEHVAAPLAHTRSPVHANPAPPVAPVHSPPQDAALAPSQPMAQPAAAAVTAAIAAAQAEAAAARAEAAQIRQQMARMAAERGHDGLARRDERDQRETTQLKHSRDTRQHLGAAAHGEQISATAVADASRPLLRDFSDPSHPQNALYSTLKDLLPKGISEERLAQGTAACHRSRITEKDLSGIYIGDKSVVFASRSLFAVPAQMDISQPAPSIQQSDQHILRTDQQREQIMSEIRTQAATQANQQQGSVLGGP